MKPLIIISILLIPLLALSQIRTVKQDGTGDFTNIQDAINMAWNSDTVLVYPGIYFENINFNGKNITVGSLLLTTGNKSYKYNTIIDGHNNGSCVVVNNNESNARLTGFTLQHGSGHKMGWDTTFIQGGGILLDKVNFLLTDCIIENNRAGHGGGVYCFNYSNLNMKSVTIRNNYVTGTGGGLSITGDAKVIFDPDARCNIYLNYAARGCEIHKVVENDTLHVYLDTCTVLQPDYHFFSSIQYEGFYIDDIVHDIQHAKLTPVDDDLYVNPVTGNDSAGGLSPNDPLKTIAYAYSKIAIDSNTRNTIHLANGTYSDTLSGEKFPLNIREYINVQGESLDYTILDGEYKSHLLEARNELSNFKYSKMTIRRGTKVYYWAFEHFTALVYLYKTSSNVKFDSISFFQGFSTGSGVIVEAGTSGGSSTKFSNCKFTDNTGMACIQAGQLENDTTLIINCTFSDNKPNLEDPEYQIGRPVETYGGTVIAINSLFVNNNDEAFISPFYANNYIVNCTFTGNSFLRNHTPFWFDSSTGNFYNSIVYNNGGNHTFCITNIEDVGTTNLNIYNSLIENGESGICFDNSCNDNCFYYYDTSNIDTDPLFYGGPDFPYNLSDESPCIDAGTLDLPQFVLDHLPDVDLAGNPRVVNDKIDMGCYEWNPTVGTGEHRISNTEHRTPNLKVFPNPYSTTTYIAARWETAARVNIEVYNNTGLLVKTLQSGKQLPGSCQIPWDGTGNNGNYLPPGIYVIILRINGRETESVKVVKN